MSGFSSKKKLPVYRHHKPSGQARVRWQGREFYLGKFNSPESRQRYAELLQKIVTGTVLDIETVSRSRTKASIESDGLSINELCVLFLQHADQHYRKNGELTSEYDLYLLAIRPLRELFGMTSIEQFGPLALKAVRDAMVAKGWTRGTVNAEVGRIRHIFRYAVENELLKDSSVLQKLEAVSPLLAGRTEAHDNEPRQAVPQVQIDAVMKLVSERCRDLIELQLCTGARPGELMKLTSSMIDRSGEVWTAELREHKTQHRGKVRRLAFGAKSQLILRKYLSADPDARLFPFRADSYRHAISRACEQLGLPHWTPHWLRHNVATRVRDEFGIEAAQAMAGHSSPLMTAHYASKMDGLAAKVAASIG